jgi:membrane-associated phospholipid phosphatase
MWPRRGEINEPSHSDRGRSNATWPLGGRRYATMTRSFTIWLGAVVGTALLVSISVAWLDRPIAILVHETFGSRHIGNAIVPARGLSIPDVTAIVFVALGLAAIMGRKFSRLETSIFFCAVSILAADVIKSQLKYAFGRTWPDSWAPGILSFIHDNAYGFHFFHAGGSYQSFPSGHASLVAAVMSVLWFMFPNLRALCVMCMLAADAGLILLNLHFLSDVIAGTFVGVSTGWFTVVLCSPNFSSGQVNLPNTELHL